MMVLEFEKDAFSPTLPSCPLIIHLCMSLHYLGSTFLNRQYLVGASGKNGVSDIFADCLDDFLLGHVIQQTALKISPFVSFSNSPRPVDSSRLIIRQCSISVPA